MGFALIGGYYFQVFLSALVAVSQAGFIGSPFRAGLIGSPYRAAIAPIARTSYIRTAPVAIARTHPVAAPAVITKAAPVIAAPAVIAKAAPVVAAAPAVVAKAAPVAAPGVHATQYHAQDELSNYEFGYQNPNSARTEKGNAELGTVAGSYSYVDGHGLTQKVNYVADAYGFRVVGTNGARTPIAAYAAAPAVHHLGKRQAVHGLGYTIPTGHLATAAPVALSAQASREAILETVKLNPGHAVAYRVY